MAWQSNMGWLYPVDCIPTTFYSNLGNVGGRPIHLQSLPTRKGPSSSSTWAFNGGGSLPQKKPGRRTASFAESKRKRKLPESEKTTRKQQQQKLVDLVVGSCCSSKSDHHDGKWQWDIPMTPGATPGWKALFRMAGVGGNGNMTYEKWEQMLVGHGAHKQIQTIL